MSSTDIEEMLVDIFNECDVDGCGEVELNFLLDVLTLQDPILQENEEIRAKLCKLLSCYDSNSMITKEHFVQSLLHHAESFKMGIDALNKNEQIETNNNVHRETCIDEEDGEYARSLSGGIEEPEGGSTLASSANSAEENSPTIYYVSEAQTLANELFVDDISVADSDSPGVTLRLAAAWENEVNSLQHKVDYLETANSSLIDQVSTLEESVAKYEKERKDFSKRLANSIQLQEMNKQKHEEAEEKFNTLLEENKLITMKLSQTERESSKLQKLIFDLEKQVDSTLNENTIIDKKNHELAEKLKFLTSQHNDTQRELDELKIKSNDEKETLAQMVEQNISLKKQLDTDGFLIQDLKSELSVVQREMRKVQSEKIKSKLQSVCASDELSVDNSMIFFDENFTLDSTIPFETSLLAELKDKESCCSCVKNLSFSSSSSVSVNTDFFETTDHAVSTNDLEFLTCDQATACGDQESCSSPEVKYTDVGVNCNIKEHARQEIKMKRSRIKWLIFGFIVLLLCIPLGVLLSREKLLLTTSLSEKLNCQLTSVFDYFCSSKKYPKFVKPVI